MDFNIASHKCWVFNFSSKIDFQQAGLKVKVSVDSFRKKKKQKKKKNNVFYGSSAYIYRGILIIYLIIT